jgi:hypothetical protein
MALRQIKHLQKYFNTFLSSHVEVGILLPEIQTDSLNINQTYKMFVLNLEIKLLFFIKQSQRVCCFPPTRKTKIQHVKLLPWAGVMRST